MCASCANVAKLRYSQVAMCEQLAVYLAKFKTPVAVTAAAESSAAVTAAPPEGYKVRSHPWCCCAGFDLVSALCAAVLNAQAR